MSSALNDLVQDTLTNPDLLRRVNKEPGQVAEELNLSEEETEALKSGNFNSFAETVGATRLFRAASHDDAYLS